MVIFYCSVALPAKNILILKNHFLLKIVLKNCSLQTKIPFVLDVILIWIRKKPFILYQEVICGQNGPIF